MAFGDGFSMQSYVQSHGPDLYRRGRDVLEAHQSTGLPGDLRCARPREVHRATDADEHAASGTAPDERLQYVEAARALAERVLLEGGPQVDGRIAVRSSGSRLLHPRGRASRAPGVAVAKQRKLFAADPEAAKKVLRVGEAKPKGAAGDVDTAAWAMVCNLILNLDETINRN